MMSNKVFDDFGKCKEDFIAKEAFHNNDNIYITGLTRVESDFSTNNIQSYIIIPYPIKSDAYKWVVPGIIDTKAGESFVNIPVEESGEGKDEHKLFIESGQKMTVYKCYSEITLLFIDCDGLMNRKSYSTTNIYRPIYTYPIWPLAVTGAFIADTVCFPFELLILLATPSWH